MKRILFFGDSNTWGYTPGTGERYSEDVRWTAAAAKLLGPEYCCIECGINGRTTVYDDPWRGCRKGRSRRLCPGLCCGHAKHERQQKDC